MRTTVPGCLILASVVVLATSVACDRANPTTASPLPSVSSVDSDARVFGTEGKGGGGGKKPGGGTGGTGTISLVMVTDYNIDGLPNFGDTVTFAVQTTATPSPWVNLKCSQNGTVVSQESNGIFPASLDQNFTLGGSPAWQSGAADCTATLFVWGGSNLASMSFHVNP
jgi:hypothetical protein